MRKRSKDDVAPRAGVIPHIDEWETPSAIATRELMHAVSHGLGIEACASYANVPAAYVRNWIARGRKQELTPFDADMYTDKETRETHLKHHRSITVPCFNFWMLWKKTRAEFLMGCVKKVMRSKDWHAQAWLLERVEPGTFVKANAPNAIKRELLPYEKEVEAVVRDDPEGGEKEVVQILLPDNNRKAS